MNARNDAKRKLALIDGLHQLLDETAIMQMEHVHQGGVTQALAWMIRTNAMRQVCHALLDLHRRDCLHAALAGTSTAAIRQRQKQAMGLN